MSINRFFVKKGPFPLKEIINNIGCSGKFTRANDFAIYGVESLSNATKNDMTFLNSSRYKNLSLKTKAAACITSCNLSKFLPDNCIKLDVKNILFAVTQVSRMFYPKADIDYPDTNLLNSSELKKLYPNVNFGKNVLIGKNVDIGNRSYIGSNSIIESNVSIGENCVIGSFVTIKNSLINARVHIRDGARIGIKGFGFIPIKQKNLRTPQIGKVILEEGVEIGANCTVDRGSVTDTIIGKNTFLDNHIHIAHNVKIGEDCMMAAQVGISGSTIIGNNVMIGGQAGIAGHLKIGNNVKIGGASGVTTDLADNSKVMGYPAMPMKEFARLRNKIEK
jgi:UDP-3-O-[3-hydroxymyristoyl] glucosamine N-acyltransferase